MYNSDHYPARLSASEHYYNMKCQTFFRAHLDMAIGIEVLENLEFEIMNQAMISNRKSKHDLKSWDHTTYPNASLESSKSIHTLHLNT